MNNQRVFLICLVLISSKLFGATLDTHNNTGVAVGIKATFGEKSTSGEEWINGFGSKTIKFSFNRLNMLKVVFYSIEGILEEKKIELARDEKGRIEGGIATHWVLVIEGVKGKLTFRIFLGEKEYKSLYSVEKRFTP